MSGNGGPAFPRPQSKLEGEYSDDVDYGAKGMTLRDYFAAAALAALPVAFDAVYGSPEQLAYDAYVVADAMLAERAKGGDRGNH